jgi:N-succinyl-L-ornithine transcarbamylase
MKQFTSIEDVNGSVHGLVDQGLDVKANPFSSKIGQGKTLGMIFFNPSLRTRMSTQKAAYNLGMDVISLNVGDDGWKIEMEEGAVMEGGSQEHIKDAVKVMSQYVDVLGVRTFAGLKNQSEDYAEKVLNNFIQHAEVPVVSLESTTLHPLQSLTDMMTIKKPKVAITWAPHPKALPQAVTNSFLQWANQYDLDLTLACPEGYEPAAQFTKGIKVTNNQDEALNGADIVYTKNWSSFEYYGQVLSNDKSWMISADKMKLTNNGKFMHCLPVRRNVVVGDEVLDGSIVYNQAKNREYAAQIVLKKILENLNDKIE